MVVVVVVVREVDWQLAVAVVTHTGIEDMLHHHNLNYLLLLLFLVVVV